MGPEGNGAGTGTAAGVGAGVIIDPSTGGHTAGPGASWELPAEPRTAARARALTARALDAWHVTDPGDVDDIVLMVDELVTNAVVHGAGPVRLGLYLDGARLIGEVGDADPAAPGPARPAPPVLDWAEAGRGLLLVTALATGFGARSHPAGKTVWFTRDLHRTAADADADARRPVTAVGAAPAREAAPPPRH
ncbi:MAG TPA: ATP-binding protein [Spirillospora sp.]|nr:ATP-binding protein [Spirillospora sp.]